MPTSSLIQLLLSCQWIADAAKMKSGKKLTAFFESWVWPWITPGIKYCLFSDGQYLIVVKCVKYLAVDQRTLLRCSDVMSVLALCKSVVLR